MLIIQLNTESCIMYFFVILFSIYLFIYFLRELQYTNTYMWNLERW